MNQKCNLCKEDKDVRHFDNYRDGTAFVTVDPCRPCVSMLGELRQAIKRRDTRGLSALAFEAVRNALFAKRGIRVGELTPISA